MKISFPLKSVFLAIPLEQEAKEKFQEIQRSLSDFEDILRFQSPKTPHLTLQFWKELMEIEHGQVIRQAEKIAKATERFTLTVNSVDTFGSRGHDRVLFLTVAFSDELARLKKVCPWPSEAPFHPHITIARIRNPQKFAVHKKKIMKILSKTLFEISAYQICLYGEVDGVKQALIQRFNFST